MKTALLPLDKITVLPWMERGFSKVDDDVLRKSIEASGIQQPLVVVQSESGVLLAKGLRRLRVARALSIAKVPVVIDNAPKSEPVESYVRRLRFILGQHRQDLLPTQRAALVETLKRQFEMSQKQVAAYLGVDQDSVTNWMAITRYVPEVQQLMAAGRLAMRTARVFDGMTREGQLAILQKHEKELTAAGSSRAHKALRAQYPPEKFPTFYQDAPKLKAQLQRKQAPRTGGKRPSLTADEKRRLSHNYELKETELETLRREAKQMKGEIMAAAPVVAAIVRNEKLLALVPEEMREELERFAEIY